MNTEIVKTPSVKLPQIGDIWHHYEYDAVFMRIVDMPGAAALGTTASGWFFSVSLSSGSICKTSVSDTNIEILKPEGETLRLIPA